MVLPDKYKSFHRKAEEPKSYVTFSEGTRVPPMVPAPARNEPIDELVPTKLVVVRAPIDALVELTFVI
jgi:hypothetical protein